MKRLKQPWRKGRSNLDRLPTNRELIAALIIGAAFGALLCFTIIKVALHAPS